MNCDKKMQPTSVLSDVSGPWLSACLQPWSALGDWNAYWGKCWKWWISAIGSAPNPWLPALADERPGQPATIDFFLPWMPRGNVAAGCADPVGEKDVIRTMLRAAVPHVGVVRPVGQADTTTGQVRRERLAPVSTLPVADTPPVPVAETGRKVKAVPTARSRRKSAGKADGMAVVGPATGEPHD